MRLLPGFRQKRINPDSGEPAPGRPALRRPLRRIIAAAGGESLPQPWLDQLAMGGRLVAPARSANGQQHLVVVDRTPQGLVSRTLDVVNFVPLKSGTA